MLVSIVQKLQEKSPLNYAIFRNSRSLSLIVMSTEPKVCTLQFSALVDKLFATKWISERVAENAKLQMQEFFPRHVRKINPNSKTTQLTSR